MKNLSKYLPKYLLVVNLVSSDEICRIMPQLHSPDDIYTNYFSVTVTDKYVNDIYVLNLASSSAN